MFCLKYHMKNSLNISCIDLVSGGWCCLYHPHRASPVSQGLGGLGQILKALSLSRSFYPLLLSSTSSPLSNPFLFFALPHPCRSSQLVGARDERTSTLLVCGRFSCSEGTDLAPPLSFEVRVSQEPVCKCVRFVFLV
jgi:hypothetical protein